MTPFCAPWLPLTLTVAVSWLLGVSGHHVGLSSDTHWTRGSKAAEDLRIPVHIALRQANIESGADSLLSLSNSGSLEYGRHWTAARVARAFAPTPETILAVLSWLNGSGISADRVSRSHGGGYLQFDSTTGEAGRLLNTTFYHFIEQGAGRQKLACNVYELPESLSTQIDYIIPAVQGLPLPTPIYAEKEAAKSVLGAHHIRTETLPTTVVNCSKYTAPSCLRDIYNIPMGVTPHPENSFGIYELAWATWLPDDLDMFFSIFQPNLTGRRPIVEKIDGGYRQSAYKIPPFNLEPDLDFEYAIALTSPQAVTDVQVGDEFRLGDVNNMLAAFDKYYCGMLDSSLDPSFPDPHQGGYNRTTDCGTKTPPKVLSVSFSDTEAAFPSKYLRRQCQEFMKLGLMGVTVVVASGDTGAASGPSPGTCLNANMDISGRSGRHFSPGWPAACPWVTAVGGTQRVTQPDLKSPSLSPSDNGGPPASLKARRVALTGEIAFHTTLGNETLNTTLSSGGGFSNVFPAPLYQHKAIAGYQSREKKHLAQLNGHFNRRGRGFPDIAALALSYLTVVEGQVVTVDGTSAAAPVFASMITMINNERLTAGKGPVGFVNPALYAHPEVLNDVAGGANQGCGYAPAFLASEGWDPVTGLGSPDYLRMRKLFMSLPHVNPLKYTCPRCGIHTCSLACVKKHKLWAQCSGIRNPAAFKKQSELATPAAIDQDFNFITKVERSIQRADDDVLAKGIELVPAGVLRPYQKQKTKFDWEAENNGVKVVRAPKGLSRSKQNRSRWDHKHQTISWTLEFILPDDRRIVNNCHETKTLAQAYRNLVGWKWQSKKRGHTEDSSKNRSASIANSEPPNTEQSTTKLEEPEATEPQPKEVQFYLQRPDVPSKWKCVIPASGEASLRDLLKDKTILEFPTIYIRHESPAELPDPFITEADYREKFGSELPIGLPSYGATVSVPALEEGEVEDGAVGRRGGN